MGCKGSRVRILPRRPIQFVVTCQAGVPQGGAGFFVPAELATYNGRRMATVVFADLVGSTGIFERLGDETAGRFVTQLTTALSKTFEQHNGRVVKLLGDGLFVVVPGRGRRHRGLRGDPEAAAGHTGVSRRHRRVPCRCRWAWNPAKWSRSRATATATPSTAPPAWPTWPAPSRSSPRSACATRSMPQQRQQLRSLGPMYLRGKSEATEVYRVQWQPERDLDATMMGASMFKPAPEAHLELMAGGQTIRLDPQRQAGHAGPRHRRPRSRSTIRACRACMPPSNGAAAISS